MEGEGAVITDAYPGYVVSVTTQVFQVDCYIIDLWLSTVAIRIGYTWGNCHMQADVIISQHNKCCETTWAN